MTDVNSQPYEIAEAELQIPLAKSTVEKIRDIVQRKETALGVNGRRTLSHLLNSPFLRHHMNVRALKTRLRSRKFELDRIERSYRKQLNGMSVS
jgi:hypothetical protein